VVFSLIFLPYIDNIKTVRSADRLRGGREEMNEFCRKWLHLGLCVGLVCAECPLLGKKEEIHLDHNHPTKTSAVLIVENPFLTQATSSTTGDMMWEMYKLSG